MTICGAWSTMNLTRATKWVGSLHRRCTTQLSSGYLDDQIRRGEINGSRNTRVYCDKKDYCWEGRGWISVAVRLSLGRSTRWLTYGIKDVPKSFPRKRTPLRRSCIIGQLYLTPMRGSEKMMKGKFLLYISAASLGEKLCPTYFISPQATSQALYSRPLLLPPFQVIIVVRFPFKIMSTLTNSRLLDHGFRI